MRVGARIMLAHHPGLQKPWTPPLQPCKSHAAATARIRLCWTSWPCPWPRGYRGMLWCPSHPDPTMHRSAEQKRWNVLSVFQLQSSEAHIKLRGCSCDSLIGWCSVTHHMLVPWSAGQSLSVGERSLGHHQPVVYLPDFQCVLPCL